MNAFALPDIHLDLGCGDMPRNPYGRARLCGVDLRKRDSDTSFEHRVANLSVEPIPWPDNSFGSVSAFDFIEHVPRVLATPDGNGTRLPFVELMNEVWRVLAPGGRFYALTPAWPRIESFTDPTHVNVITEGTHSYFCGAQPGGAMYGFTGRFDVLRSEWALLPAAASAARVLSPRESFKRWLRLRRGRLTHLLWEFAAVKP